MSVKKVCLTGSFLLAHAIFALLPGEISTENQSKLEWLNCSPVPLGKINTEIHKNIPALRGFVFFYTRSDESNAMVTLLDNARSTFQGKALFSVITPDDTIDASEFRRRHKDARVRFAVDLDRKTTARFMQGGGMILPAGFLMDGNGKILWRGEAADLPEAVQNALSGKLDTATQQKTAALTDQIQQALSNSNMLQIIQLAEKIFALEPGHPAALRMAVFAAESMQNSKLAWQITINQFRQAPHLPRIAFTALDLMLQHPELQTNLPGLINDFSSRDALPMIRYAFADALLRNFNYNLDAVLGAKNIISSTPLALDAKPEEMAVVLSLKARLFYALGDIDRAEENQNEALQICTSVKDLRGKTEARKMLDFFRGIKKESTINKR